MAGSLGGQTTRADLRKPSKRAAALSPAPRFEKLRKVLEGDAHTSGRVLGLPTAAQLGPSRNILLDMVSQLSQMKPSKAVADTAAEFERLLSCAPSPTAGREKASNPMARRRRKRAYLYNLKQFASSPNSVIYRAQYLVSSGEGFGIPPKRLSSDKDAATVVVKRVRGIHHSVG
eukprot:8212619-Prorocentrum_lima.AAC.1